MFLLSPTCSAAILAWNPTSLIALIFFKVFPSSWISWASTSSFSNTWTWMYWTNPLSRFFLSFLCGHYIYKQHWEITFNSGIIFFFHRTPLEEVYIELQLFSLFFPCMLSFSPSGGVFCAEPSISKALGSFPFWTPSFLLYYTASTTMMAGNHLLCLILPPA